MSRLRRQKSPAILKHEAEPGNNNAAAHPAIIALNHAYLVTFVISGAEVNRVVAGNLTGGNSLRGVIRVDQLPSLGRVFLRKEFGYGNFRERRIGIKFRTIGPDNFLRF